MKTKFDVIVLGLGATGSAAMYQLAKRGARVLGIDQYSLPHAYGSSHGDSRITRQAIGEGDQYTPLALRSHEIWRELEIETGRRLLTVTGGLIVSDPSITIGNHGAPFFRNTVAAAKRYAIPHEVLGTAQIRARFPQFNVRDGEAGYFEMGAGVLYPEECIAAQLELSQKYKAQLKEERMLSFEADQNEVTVQTEKGSYIGSRLIIAAGSWLPQLLPEGHAQYFKVHRQVMYWFDIKNLTAAFSPERFPIFIWDRDEAKGIYGFPAIHGAQSGVKIAGEQYESETTPQTVNREVSSAEVRSMYESNVAPCFPGLSEKCLKAVVCLYTVTPDFGFVIDRHPEHENVIVASPCSGHGFKHSAAIGEVLADLSLKSKTGFDISNFTFARFSEKT